MHSVSLDISQLKTQACTTSCTILFEASNINLFVQAVLTFQKLNQKKIFHLCMNEVLGLSTLSPRKRNTYICVSVQVRIGVGYFTPTSLQYI